VSFWDKHEVKQGKGAFLSPDEKAALIESGQPFDVTGIKYEAEGKFGARYVLSLAIPDAVTGEPESRKIGFVLDSGVESRDEIVKAMAEEHFGAGEESAIPCILSKGGNAILILPAPGQNGAA